MWRWVLTHILGVLNTDPTDLKLLNKQIVWTGLGSSLISQFGFVTGDGLISEDGRTLFDIGYFGSTLDAFANPTAARMI